MYKTEISQKKYEESKKVLAGGVASSLRSTMLPVPLFVDRAKGSKLWDVDGNEYIDYLLAYGPLILGHGNEELTNSVTEAMNNGSTYGLQHDGEIQLAKTMTQLLPSADYVSFSGSGTEAVMLALRLSRQYTKRQKVVRFNGHFHGWSDSIFTSFLATEEDSKNNETSSKVVAGTGGQSKRSLEDMIVIEWNDLQALEDTIEKYGDEIAAIITEPVMCNSGCIIPEPGYLERMRELTEEKDIVLIFDEVITGFRFSSGGAQKRFGITPDLTTVGKALGGGIAVSAVAGKAEIMQLIERGEVSHLGTLNGNCVASAAALNVIEQLTKNDDAVLKQMESLTKLLVGKIRQLIEKHQVNGLINTYGPVFHMMFIDEPEVKRFATYQKRDAKKYEKFAALLLEEGVLVRPSGLWYLSSAHTEEDIEKTVAAMDRALSKL